MMQRSPVVVSRARSAASSPPVTRGVCAALALCAVLAIPGCPKEAPPPPPPPATTQDNAKTEIMGGNEAVYDANTPPDPRAAALCDALYTVPATRKAACCSEPAAASPVVATCTGVLSAALKSGAVTLDEQKARACAAAQEQALAGCGWVGVLAPPLPPACKGLFTGTLDAGAACRSSYECKGNLRCHGSSALDAGRCGPPRPPKAPCGAAIDGLAVVTGQVAVDDEHPECQQSCGRGRCTAHAAVGDACFADGECGADHRCENKVCVKGRLAVGDKCVLGGCVDGARCMGGTCQRLRKAGEACDSEFDCAQGGCVKASLTAQGVCGMRCTSWHDVETKPGAALLQKK